MKSKALPRLHPAVSIRKIRNAAYNVTLYFTATIAELELFL